MDLQITRYPSQDIRRRLQLFNHFGIDKIFDVGANTGGYATSLRAIGYKEQIISFEPLSEAFAALEKKSTADPNWQVRKIALGNEDGKATINVSKNLVSSSIAQIDPKHVESEPLSKYVSTEVIDIYKLDTVFGEYVKKGDRVLLKIDTQGFEKNVLDGAKSSLPSIIGIQLEMSIVPLYSNELLMADMLDYLSERNFSLHSLENGFADPKTGQLLQVDGIFFRNNI